MSADKIALISEQCHDDSQSYTEEDYVRSGDDSQDTSTPHSTQSPLGSMSCATAKNQMLDSDGPQTHVNPSAIAGFHPVSSAVYGFRPAFGCPGVLFQIFLQGPFIAIWEKQKELEFWIAFEGQGVPSVLHKTESEVSLPEMGKNRYILQCIVPEQYGRDRCPITLSVLGTGGETIVGGLLLGMFQYILNDGTLNTYKYGGNMVAMLRWLKENPPQDIDYLTPVNQCEVREKSTENTIEAPKPEDVELQFQQYSGFSQDPEELSQYRHNIPGAMWIRHGSDPLVDVAQQEYQYNEEFYPQYYASQELLSAPFPNLDFNPSGNSPNPKCLQITPFYVNNFPQQYPHPQARMLQSNHTKRRAQTLSHRPHRSTHGYGKLDFVHKPDKLHDFSQWSPQERQDNRRIVAFHRAAHGDVIQLDCFPVQAHEYNENMITISCIRWAPSPPQEIQHKLCGEFVFTSVDIILLIEKLVNHNFAVQEKNRIRRNLEGFRPATVKKEGETLRFFNQVMSYSQPKARNIEKDIKVFLWTDISKALRKIIQKYHVNGGVALGKPNSEHCLSHTISSQSSSESLSAQHSFLDGGCSDPHLGISGHDHMYPLGFYSSSAAIATDIAQAYFPQDDGGESSGCSISPQSQTSESGVPMEFDARSCGSDQQILEEHIHDIPGEFSF